jgi:hypothetical protein
MPELTHPGVTQTEEFFERYGTALTAGDLEGIALCYSYPSLVVTDTASRSLSSPEEVIAAFGGADEMDEAVGLTRAVAGIQKIEGPVGGVVWVTVRWSYRDCSDEERFADAYRYLLREVESTIEICTVTPVPVDWRA